jgi:TonB family protein
VKGAITHQAIAPFWVNRLRLPLDWLTSKMASATTSDFVRTDSRTDAPPFSMIEQKGLLRRLVEELRRASREMASNPRGFIRDLLSDETKDTKRRRLIRIGLLCALAAHLALIGIIVVLGWHSAGVSASEQPEYTVTMLPTTANPQENSGTPKGETPPGKEDGGGGGQNSLRPASGGAIPQMSPAPQVVHPLAPSPPRPVLPVPATIIGPQSDAPPPTAVLGIPTSAVDAPPSSGTGSGGGMGEGRGTGAGSSSGTGAGPGKEGGEGGGNRAYGSPNGTNVGTGPIDWRRPPRDGGYTPFTWVQRVRAIVTPEAQTNKTVGVVLLRATFRADGTVTDIEIINPVPFMTDAAIEALKRSKFRPATYNGVPVTLTNVLVYQNVHY